MRDIIATLIKAEATLVTIVKGESPVDSSSSNAHNYFAEQCGYLEAQLEKCERLLENISSTLLQYSL